MREGAVILRGDLFGICDRLKAIDEGYFVVYDKATHSFEVHNRFQRGNTFALKVPYPQLDVRTVDYVRKTRAENAKKLFAETERENARLRREQIKKAVEHAAVAAEKTLGALT